MYTYVHYSTKHLTKYAGKKVVLASCCHLSVVGNKITKHAVFRPGFGAEKGQGQTLGEQVARYSKLLLGANEIL